MAEKYLKNVDFTEWPNRETEEEHYAPVIIYLADHEKECLFRLGVTNNKNRLFEIMQYLLDGMNEKKFDTDIIIRDTLSGKYISAKWIREKYGLRVRNFNERMKNVQTWRVTEDATH